MEREPRRCPRATPSSFRAAGTLRSTGSFGDRGGSSLERERERERERGDTFPVLSSCSHRV